MPQGFNLGKWVDGWPISRQGQLILLANLQGHARLFHYGKALSPSLCNAIALFLHRVRWGVRNRVLPWTGITSNFPWGIVWCPDYWSAQEQSELCFESSQSSCWSCDRTTDVDMWLESLDRRKWQSVRNVEELGHGVCISYLAIGFARTSGWMLAIASRFSRTLTVEWWSRPPFHWESWTIWELG